MVKFALVTVAIALGLLAIAEVGLRVLFGFGNPLLYIADDRIGYLLAPNQRTRRFGNRIEINSYSMRFEPISPQPEASTLRVLLLGDSIASGGWWTDLEDTVSARIARLLPGKLGEFGELGDGQIEVLNASANSWGPRNELAYLEKFGYFHARAVVVLINTDDFFTIAPTSLPVGSDRNYPDRKPLLGLTEVIERYVLPEPTIPELDRLHQEKGDRVGKNLAAIEQIHALLAADGIPLILALSPLLREVSPSGPKDYELKARDRLQTLVSTRNIPFIDFLPVFAAMEQPELLYRDTIHPSAEGNRILSDGICQLLITVL
ncbi:SGNH/GDSL hydrolase family protein [Oscillatoriales cyanobacterium LEGE 11467]|uniref:SGNH/GDSL hydrolase family protein n=1 Tax=Zarconia navalis LEGE 11467 TaxID=1828826 RepID=A0A928Z7I5_9CYAN|nr:SGNH/GDSL hydrolase family protein [Zarconia navalis LEGE 11467]